MTLVATLPYAYKVGNNATTDFSFDFRAFQVDIGDTGVIVSIEDNDPSSGTYGDFTVKTEGVDYSVALDADPDDASQTLGGTVTFGTAPAALENILILSQTALTQQKNYSGGGTFPAASHEDGLDKLTRVNQEQDLAINMAIRVPIFESLTFNATLPKAEIRADKSFGFDSNGDISMITLITQAVIDSINASEAASALSATAAATAETGSQTAQGLSETAQGLAEDAQVAAEAAQTATEGLLPTAVEDNFVVGNDAGAYIVKTIVQVITMLGLDNVLFSDVTATLTKGFTLGGIVGLSSTPNPATGMLQYRVLTTALNLNLMSANGCIVSNVTGAYALNPNAGYKLIGDTYDASVGGGATMVLINDGTTQVCAIKNWEPSA